MSLSKEELIRMAIDAGFDTDKFERSCTPQKCDIDIFDELSRFANAAYAAGAKAERDVNEMLVKPKGNRPCDCERCECGNSGDAADVATWDALTLSADAIRARNGGEK